MPDVLTHAYCADFSRRNIDESTVLRQILDQNIDAFYLGAQGPDFFYYFGIWPWKKNYDIPSFADTIHKNKTGQFLTAAFNLLLSEDLSSKKGQMRIAYWMGFLSHYALDTTAHPFIHYFSGLNKDDASKKNGDDNHHKYLENIIDTILSRKFNFMPGLPLNQHSCIPKHPEKFRPVYEQVSEVYEAVFEQVVSPDVIENSVRDMHKLLRLIYDPKYRKRGMYAKMEKGIMKPQYITTAAFPADADYNFDYLNTNHQVWNHPCDSALEYRQSFLDLFDRAILRSENLMLFAWNVFKNQETLASFEDILDNISYDTGLPCQDPREIKHSKSVFKK